MSIRDGTVVEAWLNETFKEALESKLAWEAEEAEHERRCRPGLSGT